MFCVCVVCVVVFVCLCVVVCLGVIDYAMLYGVFVCGLFYCVVLYSCVRFCLTNVDVCLLCDLCV